MNVIRLLALCLLATAVVAGDGETTADPDKGPGDDRKALDRVFAGRILRIRKKRVTIYYDFEDPAQLQDFEPARPPRLLDASQNQVSIEAGRLVLEGSSAIRHRMEGKGELGAHFFVRIGDQRNVGTFFSPPILNDFYVVLNLFDERFYGNGGLILAGCGLHEDEGAEDISSGLVNWRDIFRSDVRKTAKVGTDIEVEVRKDGWAEYCRVNDVEGRGSSKGKTSEMESYHFGLWVHESRASFDDLTITLELTDEFLDLNDLAAAVSTDYEDVPATGPFAGMANVSPRLRTLTGQYVEGRGDAGELVRAIANRGLDRKVREVVADVLCQRKDPRVVPLVIDALYSPDKDARRLAIGVVKAITGDTFGYSATAGEKARSKAIQKLNQHLAENRRKYFG